MCFRWWTWCPYEVNSDTGHWCSREGWQWVATNYNGSPASFNKGKGKGQ